jgi:hypothetical protein
MCCMTNTSSVLSWQQQPAMAGAAPSSTGRQGSLAGTAQVLVIHLWWWLSPPVVPAAALCAV